MRFKVGYKGIRLAKDDVDFHITPGTFPLNEIVESALLRKEAYAPLTYYYYDYLSSYHEDGMVDELVEQLLAQWKLVGYQGTDVFYYSHYDQNNLLIMDREGNVLHEVGLEPFVQLEVHRAKPKRCYPLWAEIQDHVKTNLQREGFNVPVFFRHLNDGLL